MTQTRPLCQSEFERLRALYALGPGVPATVSATAPATSGPAPEVYLAELGGPPGRAIVVADLRDLLGEYRLFQHAALVLCGGLRYDPVELYYAEYSVPYHDRHRVVSLQAPLVVCRHTLLAREFYTVRACPLSSWPGLARALGLVAGRSAHRFWVSLRQDIEIPSRTDLPAPVAWACDTRARISFFGVEGSDYTAHFVPPLAGQNGPLRLELLPPSPGL